MIGKPMADKNSRGACKILLTRPQGSNESMAEALLQQGHDVRVLPLLAIQQSAETAKIKQTIMDIDHYQKIICSSKHAAAALAHYLDQYWPQMPSAIHWYTLGRSSASPLEELGINISYPGSGNTSEDVLAMIPLTQVTGQKILLVKGKGGRQELQQILTQRGAYVHTLELYQREPVEYPSQLVNELLMAWQPDIVVLMSGETIERFRTLSDTVGHHAARNTTQKPRPNHKQWVIVPGERLARIAENSGFRTLAAGSAEHDTVLRVIEGVINDIESLQ